MYNYICIYLSLSIYLSFYLFVYLSIHLSIYPSIHLSIYLSISIWDVDGIVFEFKARLRNEFRRTSSNKPTNRQEIVISRGASQMEVWQWKRKGGRFPGTYITIHIVCEPKPYWGSSQTGVTVTISGRFLLMSSSQNLRASISEPTSHWNEPSSKMAFWVLCSRCLAQFGTVQTPGMCGKLGHTGKC